MKHLPALISLLLLGSCVYPYNALPSEEIERIPVIDAKIVTGDKATLSLNWVIPLTATNSYKIDIPYQWWIVDDQGTVYPATSPTEVPLANAPVDRKYQLHLEMEGNVYESDWLESITPPDIDNIVFTADEKYVYSEATIKPGKNSSGYIALSMVETWEFHTQYEAEYIMVPETGEIVDVHDPSVLNYYCWKTLVTDAESIWDLKHMDRKGFVHIPFNSFARTNNRNHRLYSVLLIARNISEEEYRYRYNLLQNKEGGNDIFTPNPGQMQGNVRCISDESIPVMGYVAISQAFTMRAWMDNSFYKATMPYEGNLIVLEPEQYLEYYNNWEYRPVKMINLEEGSGLGWGPARCVDCLYDGGTLEKPDFWDEYVKEN